MATLMAAFNARHFACVLQFGLAASKQLRDFGHRQQAALRCEEAQNASDISDGTHITTPR
jgi:hypothetical protein